jgi:hypothetical protein
MGSEWSAFIKREAVNIKNLVNRGKVYLVTHSHIECVALLEKK